jgi:hypothetical protein
MDECVQAPKSIEIIHLHERLGYLPWEKNPDGRALKTRAFDGAINNMALQVCVHEIKIIHEEVADDRDFQKSQKIIKRRSNNLLFRIWFSSHKRGAAWFTPRQIRRMDLYASTTEAEIQTAMERSSAGETVVNAADRAMEREVRRVLRGRGAARKDGPNA